MQRGFVYRKTNGILYYACQAIEELSGFRHGFSTRHGGLPGIDGACFNLGYTHWDTTDRVNANRQHFLAALNLDQAQLATLHQIHSDRIHIIREVPDQWDRAEGDALITPIPGLAIAVQTADCLPILIADPVKNVAAAVHSGWKGTHARILQKTIREMQQSFGCDTACLIAAIGPGIRSCCFEVGEDVAALFDREYPGCRLATPVSGRPGKFLLDLPKALELQLNQAGVESANSHDLCLCTRCNVHEFFSYRAEGQNSGRMMAVIGGAENAPWLMPRPLGFQNHGKI